MSITINGATNTLTAASGLTVAGNTAVTGTLSATTSVQGGPNGGGGLILQTYTGGTFGAIYSTTVTPGATNYSLATAGANTYLNGTVSSNLSVGNTAIAAATATGLAVTGTLSATGLLSGTAGVQFRGADATTYELMRVVGVGANNPGLFVKATEATKTVELYQSGSAGGETLVIGGVATYTATALTLGTGVNLVMAAASTVQLGGYTVATLPAAGTAGRTAYVTDATAPTYLGALTGGGAVVCPVFDNGVAWVSA